MKKLFTILFLTVTMLCLFSVCVLAAADAPAVVVTAENGELPHVLPIDSTYYLPSCADVRALRFDAALSLADGDGVRTLSAGEALDLSPYLAADKNGEPCYRLTLIVGGAEKTFVFYHDPSLPSLLIQTSKGLSFVEASKENRDKDAEVLLLDANGSVCYSDADEESTSELKGRGNATWSYYKKPYQLKLGKKTALLGMEKSKTWILLAGYTDQSALHNALAFTLAEDLRVPFAIDYRFVNLYIDGAYRGLYMLCEKVQIDESRVDIRDLEKENEDANPDDDPEDFTVKTVSSGALIDGTNLQYFTYCEGMASPEDITGGYLVELDNIRGASEPCRFQTKNGNIYVVKSPEFASREEMEYVAALFADMEEAIYSETGYNRKGIHYGEYIDVESFSAIYVCQELLKNWDAYLSSMFFFKDADTNGKTAKIYMGPLWDMDNTLGNINFNLDFGTDTAYLWAQNGIFQSYHRGFAKNLMKHADFARTVQKTYHAAYASAERYLREGGWLERTVSEIRPAVTMDRVRWQMGEMNRWLLNAAGYKTSVKFVWFRDYGTAFDETKDTALGFMRYYLSERMEALLLSLGGGSLPQIYPETTSATHVLTEAVTTVAQTAESTEADTQTTAPTAVTDGTDVPAQKDDMRPFILPAAVLVLLATIGMLLFIRMKKAGK